MQAYQQEFIELALTHEALRFGEFRLKSGRLSPYFFNAGQFNTGGAVATLGRCYGRAITESGLQFDMLFGPAYKGIPLVTATAMALADWHSLSVPFAFNRKEAKTHGEGGSTVGAPIAGRVLIIDDVISAGTAIRESVEIIRAAIPGLINRVLKDIANLTLPQIVIPPLDPTSASPLTGDVELDAAGVEIVGDGWCIPARLQF